MAAEASLAKKAKTEGILEKLEDERKECAKSVMEFKFNKKRVRTIRGDDGQIRRECKGVLYMMWRDKRVQDNWSMLYSQKMAMDLNVPLQVIVCVPKNLGELTLRHYNFLLEGLKDVSKECDSLDIGFHLELGTPPDVITKSFLDKYKIGLIVSDFSPLRYHREWLESLEKSTSVAIHQVDSHNIVPVWVTSDKQEYAARTIRPKITKNLSEYLTSFPPVIKHPVQTDAKIPKPDFKSVLDSLDIDRTGWGVEPPATFTPGADAALANLQEFVAKRLKVYDKSRNDPNVEALSRLSPWVNHGQISMQRAVLYVKKHGKSHSEGVSGFIEEAVVRRELSDNFCYYNTNYDKIKGATDWAQKTLNDHRKDKREYVYSRKELENGHTHDDLWNASQLQLVKEGKLHGFLRMYWAKKVLEWTESPEVALKEAIRLNDRYALDGNDPNGYVGVMWSVAGIHDQGWGERAIFGKIRYMNYAGCKRKFDVNKFVIKYGAKTYNKGGKDKEKKK
eukprot:TRINITY_DN5756_c0_g1_i3.p1 TRINITY_DN5756_c0_g1~~TRINITY_DN5756_c0_g1_i3.p1  ORF type:complete len:525 (-),score=182.13 TRINITY_DN5756_c0_g1_i3:776-2293(-)